MKVLDLFSGIGGFSLGLERAGMETVAFCEIDPHAGRVLAKHWPQIHQFQDIHKLSYERGMLRYEADKLGGYQLPTKIDLICGGFPCQDISTAGKQRGLRDEEYYKELLDAGFTEQYADENSRTRSGLWFQYKRLIEEVQPKYVIIENVANLRSKGLATVLKDLWSIGYASEWHVISARSVGACHLRERIWIIAYPHGDRRISSLSLSAGDQEQDLQSIRLGSRWKALFANSDNLRFGSTITSEEIKQIGGPEAAIGLSSLFGEVYETEPTICRGDDGLSKRLDKSRRQRIKQLGNAVVPFIPELIGRAILEFERSNEA